MCVRVQTMIDGGGSTLSTVFVFTASLGKKLWCSEEWDEFLRADLVEIFFTASMKMAL